jgi:glycerol-3-phosphate dehydrogenase
VVGTTDTLIEKESLEPIALDSEVDFILTTFGKYVDKQPTRADVRSVFAGLRPLARPEKEGKKTKEISRNHKLIVSNSGLITITGGKWTTFRKMAEDTVNMAINIGKLQHKACTTHHFKIHGYTEHIQRDHWLQFYGSDTEHIENLMKKDPNLAEKLHPDYPFVKAEVIWALRNEMARSVEDILARRIRILFLDAKAAIKMAPTVAELIAKELNKDIKWIENQVESFNNTAKGYLLD